MSDLIERMHTQIQAWEETQDQRAIFLTCYWMMTDNMLQAVADSGFKDGPWVTGLTHCFADYYFDALAKYEDNARPPVWTFTFETACQKRAHVLQHLLMGVNAHICYDLIFALADSIVHEWDQLSAEGRALRYHDYCQVNDIIGATLDAVQDEVVEVHSRAMNAVDIAFGRLDEWMTHRLITRWREQVWHQSMAYVAAAPDEKRTLKQAYAQKAEQRSRAIRGQRGIVGVIDLF
jgi:hypothetical protein